MDNPLSGNSDVANPTTTPDIATSIRRSTATGITPKTIGVKKDIAYVNRLAVRIIVKNERDEIIIIFAEKGNYYKLPGGGIKADEDHRFAGEREAMEETGCKVAIDGDCMAMTEEWRNDLHQISYCYRAHLVEDTGIPELTEDEVVDGLKHEWTSVEAAIEKMKGCQPTSELGEYIKERDLYFVKTCSEERY
jgi:8-oxo-dGTP diphosphatase